MESQKKKQTGHTYNMHAYILTYAKFQHNMEQICMHFVNINQIKKSLKNI